MFSTTTLDLDMIVPVPLGPKRLKERGYNQAYLLAEAYANRLAIECNQHALRRIRETRTQVGLSIVQRQQNVTGAFKAESKEVSGKRVLLIDDILTTGATLNACAVALKQAGADRVFSLTLAHAP
ncbi:MAG: phosphoribosyltransferase family protein [Chloroflexota bacterium]